MKKQKGFTIVELLIVIVVIAILATISIVAFNGIQQRSRNVQIITAVRAYEKGLRLYAVDEVKYPDTSNFWDYAVCLGDGYPDDHCWRGGAGDYRVNSTFDTLLSKYMSAKPVVTPKYYAINSTNDRSGIVFYRNNPAGRASIEYLLEGANQNCEIDGANASNVAANTATRCFLTLPSQ